VRHRRGADRCRHASRKSNVPATDSRASSFDPVFDSCTPHTSPVSSRSRLSRARFLFLALSLGGGATLPAQPVWGVYGEVGGVLGGTWSKTEGAPTVTTGPGALLSLGAQRVSERFSLGAAVRLAAQPVSMSELGDSWSGGTLRDIHVVATTAWPLAQRGAGGLDAEAAVGLAGRLGSVRGEPFARSPACRHWASSVSPSDVVKRWHCSPASASCISIRPAPPVRLPEPLPQTQAGFDASPWACGCSDDQTKRIAESECVAACEQAAGAYATGKRDDGERLRIAISDAPRRGVRPHHIDAGHAVPLGEWPDAAGLCRRRSGITV
jgi:hypothetical protein